jgi:hypothetical protein
MTLDEILPETATFSFRSRPGSVPGDLRISWRLARKIHEELAGADQAVEIV